ncbi:unnamed protein product [Brachionus calyciflorus]|uniref:Cyclic nucleotide-binding domain-containing protein n=1 Tax=Brachionus calyciflorus TaxID=104777 RepID=A0A814J2R1_9BILA|nr:unnamed protein product [Brachionus calyciflorus]
MLKINESKLSANKIKSSKYLEVESSDILSQRNSQSSTSDNNFKKGSFFYSNYLPLFQSKLQNKKESNNLTKEYKDQSIQCILVDFRLNLNIACHVKLASNSVFLPFQIKRFNQDRNKLNYNSPNLKRSIKTDPKQLNDLNTLAYREIGVQTYADVKNSSYLIYDLDSGNKTPMEKTLEDLIYNYSIQVNSLNNKKNLIVKFINTLELLSEDSIIYLNKYLGNSGNKFSNYVESLCRLNNEKLKIFDNILVKLIKQYNLSKARNNSLEIPGFELEKKSSLIDFTKNDIHSIDLKKLIKMSEMKRKGVRFETSEEKRRLALERFKRAVRIVIINREWIKVLNSDKKEEREKLLIEYDKIENSSEFMNGKKLQILFNKEEFKAQKNLTALINDTHRKILAKEASARANEDIENLLSLIYSIPRLNTFPKHVCNHVAKLIKLIVYEKGREIVREGHTSIGFYYIINGSCDVLSMGNDGLLKIDELQSGDTFGDNSFQNGLTPYTVITNQRTEMLIVEPNEIEAYLDRLRLEEKEYVKDFISNWWPVKYWNWTEENFEKFSQYSDFLRFNSGEIITDNSFQQVEKFYFIFSGKVELIRMINVVKKVSTNAESITSCESLENESSQRVKKIMKKKFLRVCFLEKYNYFGFETSQSVNTWFRAHDDEVCVIRITKESFLSIHKHSSFFLSQLMQDYKLALPSQDQVINLFKQNLKTEKIINKIKP